MSKLFLPLIEVNMAFKPDLCEDIEREDGQKAMRVGGRFQHADLKNANGRIYPFAILEREIGKAQDKIKNRNMLGELDHPADGQTSLHRVSHVITKLEMSAAAVLGMATQASTACAQRAANASSALGAQLAPPSPAGCSFAAPTNNRSSGTCRLAR